MKIHCKYIGLILLIFSNFQAHAQSYHFLYGKIIDAENGQAVPFATIVIKGSNIGLISNEEGGFRIPDDDKYLNDTLIISSIGYEKINIPLVILRNGEGLNIELKPVLYQLPEVNIAGKQGKVSSKKIVRNAVGSIAFNLYPDKQRQVSYFRTYLRKDNEYFNLEEALIYSIDRGIRSEFLVNDHYLLDYKKNQNFREISIGSDYNYNKHIPDAYVRDYGGNDFFMLLAHNAIRNFNIKTFSFVDIMSYNFIRNHNFGNVSTFFFNNRLLYKIPFHAREEITLNRYSVNGNIYIEPDNFRIHKFEYLVNYVYDHQEKNMFNITIEYSVNPEDKYMLLNYISFNNYLVTPDPMDTNPFKLKEYDYNKNNRSLTLMFNHKLDSSYSMQYGSILITVNGYFLDLNSRIIKDNTIELKFGYKAIDILENLDMNDKSNQFDISLRRIKDVDQRLINGSKMKELYQFRELFVIDNRPEMIHEKDCKVFYNPLKENCIFDFPETDKYWMNSPFK